MDSIQVLEYYGLIDDATEISIGLQVKVHCPFHDEQVKSLNFDLEKDIFFCFGCGAKGDIVDFVKKLESINRLEAMQKVRKISAGEEEAKKEILEMVKSQRQNKQELLDRAKYYYMNLNDNFPEALQYLKDRGLTTKTIDTFGIKFNKHAQYPIIIPLYDEQEFKGYIQRRIDNGKPKYLYNKGFERLSTLVGEVKNKNPVLIVEGIFDMLKAYQFGYHNVVAILGWKASKHHLEKLSNTDYKISALDNDRAGKEGTKYLEDKLKNVVELEYLKDSKDIGEMSKKLFRKNIEATLKKF